MFHFNMRVVDSGDPYGLDGTLIAKRPMVEFYDARFLHTPLGQFVTRYDVDTFMAIELGSGLNMQGNVRDWQLTAEQVAAAQNTINAMRDAGLIER